MAKVKIDNKKLKEMKGRGEAIRKQFSGGVIPLSRQNRGILDVLGKMRDLIGWILDIIDLFDEDGD